MEDTQTGTDAHKHRSPHGHSSEYHESLEVREGMQYEAEEKEKERGSERRQ